MADAILVEGFSDEAAGGTGKGFPLRWLLPVRARFAPENDASLPNPPENGLVRPTFVLAGGLTPENVGVAIRRVRPAIVDVSSGVERAPGEKDPILIDRFVHAVRSA